ncbi:hypothetical protein AX14_009741 [Amanita brunnescens Koide BX004]|nr:hypothetical protein AX14_009741 [Amanita brunnescens Koide BX004]
MSSVIDASAKVRLDPTVDFVAGTLSGIAGLVIGHPFDTVKVRFQSPTIARQYTSTVHAFVSIVREESLAGLFKGITSPLLTAALLNGLAFSTYHFFLNVQRESNDSMPTLTQVAIAGGLTGLIGCVVVTPTELVKIRQQDQLVRTSTRQIARQILRASGVPGFYRGIWATILRDFGGCAAYFVGYEATCRLFSGSAAKSSMPWYAPLLAGGIAGVVGWAPTFPFDVVKTRMQGTPQRYTVPQKHQIDVARPITLSRRLTLNALESDPYRTVTSTIVNSYRAEGMGVFFRGLAPTLIRAVPVNMVTFATFETIAHALS